MRADRRDRAVVAGLAGLALALAPSLAGLDPTAHAWCQMVTGSIRPSFEEPCVLAANHPEIHPLAWRQRCTSLSVSDALPPRDLSVGEVQDILRAGFLAWTTADCGDGALTGLSADVLQETNACSEAAHHRSGRNVHAVIFVQDGWSTDRGHDPRAYAVTYVWHDPGTGEIFDSDIEINESRGRYVVCPEEGCSDGAVDLPNVLTHELGHYFGLAHTPDDVLATMNASAPAGETIKRTLTTDDVTGICTIYAPGSLSAECNNAPRGGLDLSCVPNGGCGCAAPGVDGRVPRSPGTFVAGLVALAWLAAVRRRSRI